MTLNVCDVCKLFGERSVLTDVSFLARAGELVSVVGPSGCGKTTLLRIIAGLEEPTSGRVELDGLRVCGPSRRFGYMYQDARLFPWFRAWRNVAFALDGRENAPTRHTAEKMLTNLGLAAEQTHLWPYQMSGGMLRRVALARAIAGQPHVLLLDEPLSALDVVAKAQLIELITAMRMGGTEPDLSKVIIINVTHDIAEAVELSDRVLSLRVGVRGARVGHCIDVSLGYPRDRLSGEFREVCARVLQTLLPESDLAVTPQSVAGDSLGG